MSIQIDRAFESTLRSRAAARGISLRALIEELVKSDERPTPILDPATATALESLRLDHGAEVGSRYYKDLDLDPETEARLWALALADKIGIDDYLKRRFEAASL